MGIDSFFGIGGPEFLFILILAGIFLGPGRIAKVARWLGQTTAKLQAISRGFVGQLKEELDMADGQEDLRDMLREMQDLRSEVTNLQNQLGSTLKDASADTEASFNELKELTNSIKPPTFEENSISNGSQNGSAPDENSIAKAENGAAKPASKKSSEPPTPPSLPKPITIEDDPE